MTGTTARYLPWREAWLPLLLPSAVVAVVLWFVFTRLPAGPQFVAESAECDKRGAILLSTHDPLDLQRAEFVVRRLNFNIGDRLPPISR